ncbi:E3 ubiquitin-protein ligase TRIM16-like [Garra rufa]|uniref:E3 ubiquitin-protein ligase TRIM16-like n=1 Tax=Garra rufa TaxID=137080 RepID=UPI003CCE80CF
MAESSVSLAQDEFICSICLDLLKDPVTLTCGHSYCMSCIKGCWDQDDQKGVYSCPQCRQTFTPRPVLGKNTILAEVVKKLKKTKLQAARPAQCYAAAGDVECDVCTGDKNKAIKSCLVCLNSYCQNHLEQHETFFKGKRHSLMDATGRLQEMICPQHEKLLEIFCRTDQQCICYPCTMDEHKNHETVSATAERTEKQEIKKISGKLTCIEIFSISEPKTREEFLQYSHQFTLDINTVNKNVSLSDGNRVIEYTQKVQPYPDHPDRFQNWEQVLCRESVCGRCYWEVEWSIGVCISVSYKSIGRKGWGNDSGFGHNNQSWSLFCSDSRCSFWHSNKQTDLPVVSSSSRIGVYVDHSAGTLSFYSVSDTMTLIHRVQNTFSQPLYPGFRLCFTFGSHISKVKL